MLAKPRAVVTGGAGFIGSHLVEGLVRRGYMVTIIDDLSTGKLDNIAHLLRPTGGHSPDVPPRSPRPDDVWPRDDKEAKAPELAITEGGVEENDRGWNPGDRGGSSSDRGRNPGDSGPHPNDNGGVDFTEGSVTELALLKDVFRGVQYVFHEAAIPSVPRSVENPGATHEANTTGTLNVLMAAKQAGVRKVVYASSSSAYGDSPMLPKREEMPPDPRSPYAVSKLAGEYYCRAFHQVYGLATASLRYFNVYGPRQDPDSQYSAVITRFIRRALEDGPPVIYGDGEQTRDFVFVRDVVEANILAAEGDAAGVFNIGRGEHISVKRLAGLVTELVGSKVQPEHQESRAGDVMHSLADISRASAFGFDPAYSLERGIRETIAAMQG